MVIWFFLVNFEERLSDDFWAAFSDFYHFLEN